VYESLKEVRDCGLEEVPLARLRSETYQKTAGKVSKVEWGTESAVAAGGGGNITIVIGRVESPYRQIAEVVAEQMSRNLNQCRYRRWRRYRWPPS
jgi:hypothetical protein